MTVCGSPSNRTMRPTMARIAAEVAAPEPLADHDSMRGRRRIVRAERAARDRHDAKDVEESRRHRLAGNPFGQGPGSGQRPAAAGDGRHRRRTSGSVRSSPHSSAARRGCGWPPGGASQSITSASGSRYGSARSSAASNRLKIAAVAPMPRARIATASAVNPGARHSTRAPYRRSRQNVMRPLTRGGGSALARFIPRPRAERCVLVR